MKFFINILVILVVTIFNLMPLISCEQDNSSRSPSDDPPGDDRPVPEYPYIITVPRRIPDKWLITCPEGEKADSTGRCRKLI